MAVDNTKVIPMRPFEQAWTLLKEMTLLEQSMQNSPELYVGGNTRPTEVGMDYKYGIPAPFNSASLAVLNLPKGTPGRQHTLNQLNAKNDEYERRLAAAYAYQRDYGLPPRNPSLNLPMDDYDGEVIWEE